MFEKLVRNYIVKHDKVPLWLRESHFAPYTELTKIRDWLEENELYRHLPIASRSTELAFLTPDGEIVLQKRIDNNVPYALWGGAKKWSETILRCAQRELFEETGVKKRLFNFVCIGKKRARHTYKSGDVVDFYPTFYVVCCKPGTQIQTSKESIGYKLIKNFEEVKNGLPEHLRDQVEFALEHTQELYALASMPPGFKRFFAAKKFYRDYTYE